MIQKLRDEWVRRLESGEYQQGKSWLRTLDGKYCCLGILCEMAVEDSIVTRELVPSHVSTPARYRYESKPGTYLNSDISRISPHAGSDNVLPIGVVKWAYVDDVTPSVFHDNMLWSLTSLNDNGVHFSIIASYIKNGRI